MAAGAVGAEPDRVVGTTQVGLVLGMTVDGSQLWQSVGELALLAVLARAVLLVGSAQLRFVTAWVDLGRRQRVGRGAGDCRG